ncbi:MAG: histidinol dehydrogenase [Candidatus Limnocylindrales bacterium]
MSVTDLVAPRLRRVRLADLSADERRAIVRRASTATPDLRERVRAIIEQVRSGGDDAVRELGRMYGGGLPWEDWRPPALHVPREELVAARDSLPRELRAGLETMAANIERFHALQVPPPEQWLDVAPGIRVGRVWRGLDRVACYVPGGSAPLPSSLLMSAIPARLAGVRELVVATPSGRDGTVAPVILGAAGLMGVGELYVMGGAQAIAALAYGTETIRAVDKVVGPGSAWVTEAKLQVLDQVGIDMPAGPTEVMVVADGTADPVHVAADLISESEHGPDSPVVLVVTDPATGDAVQAHIELQVPMLGRQDEIRTALSRGWLVEAADLAEALAFADEYAPEHLSLAVADPAAAARAIRSAGCVFLGDFSPEAAGDYASGTNHTLPTLGLARAYGALSVEAFGRWMQVNDLSREGLASIRDSIGVVAEAEGLAAHRRAVDIRFDRPVDPTIPEDRP